MLALTGKKVAVQPKFEDDTYANSTIIKPDSYKRRSTQGIVKYIGREVQGYKPGDYIFYSAYAGTLWKWKGELLILLPDYEHDILFKIDNIPYTGIKGVYLREKIDKEKNYKVLLEIFEDSKPELTGYNINNVYQLAEFLSDKVDAYGAYFEAPYEYVIERIADTFQKEEWTNNSGVNDAPEMKNLELYKDDDRICQECGGKQKQMINRTTTRVFLQCKDCGRIRDIKKIKGELK